MTTLSPEARKAQENANARHRAQERHADRGPYLSDDGKHIRIPSPSKHQKFARILKSFGFEFVWYDIPGPLWTRPTDRPLARTGKRYTPDGWLEWSRQTYAKVWPDWKSQHEEEPDETKETP